MTPSTMPKTLMSKLRAPKAYASLKNLSGRDWNNDIQNVTMGPGAVVLAC